jgi:hypothetical protein
MIYLFSKAQTGYRAHEASYSMGTESCIPEERGQGMMLTTHLYLVLKVKMHFPICLHMRYIYN